MKFVKSNMPDVIIVEPDVYEDSRGFFMETFQSEKYADAGINYDFVQDNHSHSRRGTLRGLHYQLSHVQGKLARAVVGEIFDVAVDIRRSSPTFRKWFGIRLSAENKKQLWIPPGFAHGFYVLSDWADIIYKVTDFYDPAGERCIIWNDPLIEIDWPIEPRYLPLLSEKDKKGVKFIKAEVFD